MSFKKNKALQAHGETDAGLIGSADLPNQTVVTTAGSNGVLRAETVGDHFKSRAGVIVKAPYHARIDGKGDLHLFQEAVDGGKVIITLGTQVLNDRRSMAGGTLTAGNLAVDDPERIGPETTPAIFAEMLKLAFKGSNQLVAIGRAAGRATETVDLQRDIRNLRFGKEVAEHRQNLGIDLRVGNADRFGADLVKLAIASFLRALIAEHRAEIIKFGHSVEGI